MFSSSKIYMISRSSTLFEKLLLPQLRPTQTSLWSRLNATQNLLSRQNLSFISSWFWILHHMRKCHTAITISEDPAFRTVRRPLLDDNHLFLPWGYLYFLQISALVTVLILFIEKACRNADADAPSDMQTDLLPATPRPNYCFTDSSHVMTVHYMEDVSWPYSKVSWICVLGIVNRKCLLISA